MLVFRGVSQFISQVLIQILFRISAINSIELQTEAFTTVAGPTHEVICL